MSRQINFFADPTDAKILHTWLIQELPGLKVIRVERGRTEDIQSMPATDYIATDQTVYLVPAWAVDRIVLRSLMEISFSGKTEPKKDLFRLDYMNSPVIEYWPCILDKRTNYLSRGRIYWAYKGLLAPDEKKQLDHTFRWIYSQTMPLSATSKFRIFENAARNRRILDFGFGTTQISPKWSK